MANKLKAIEPHHCHYLFLTDISDFYLLRPLDMLSAGLSLSQKRTSKKGPKDCRGQQGQLEHQHPWWTVQEAISNAPLQETWSVLPPARTQPPPSAVPCLCVPAHGPQAHSLPPPVFAAHSPLLPGCFLAKSPTSVAVGSQSNTLNAEGTSTSAAYKARLTEHCFLSRTDTIIWCKLRASPCSNSQNVTEGLLALFKFKGWRVTKTADEK